MSDDDEGLPRAHQRFSAHFTAALYESEDDEFGPFGSDEGWDMVHEWDDRRSELKGKHAKTVRYLLGDGDPDAAKEVVKDLKKRHDGDVDTAVLVLSAGFTLLRLKGTIDEDGRQLMLVALDQLQSFYGHQPAFALMRSDLTSFSIDL